MRQVVLDTETTGIDPKQGHRIIEIGCVELIDRKLTGNHYHVYINPDRIVEQEAIDVHGITNEFLADKPRFSEICDSFYEFVKGAELVIHNAPFDVGFINHEYRLMDSNAPLVNEYCGVLDTLALAKRKHPGQKNNLDALCKRYGIDNSHRELHGALLDSEILADVYLLMSGGQTRLALDADSEVSDQTATGPLRVKADISRLVVAKASDAECQEHEAYLDGIGKKADVLWRQLP